MSIEDRVSRPEKQLEGDTTVDPFSKGVIFQLPIPDLRQDDVDINKIFSALWSGKLIIAGITLIAALYSVIYSLSLPNIYQAKALLAPSDNTQSMSLAGMSGIAGLATMAGFRLPQGMVSKVTTAIEVIKSQQFITYFVDKYDLVVPLMAAEEWEEDSNTLVIDSDIYDVENKQWKGDEDRPPTAGEVYESFSGILKIFQDPMTQLVTISIDHISPEIAKDWVNLIVEEINTVTKAKDVREAEKSVQYLNQQLEKTSVADMRSVFYELIEDQTQTIMLAEVRDEYVFTAVDPAALPEKRLKPNRPLICIAGTVAGMFFGVFVVLGWNFLRSHKLV